METINKLGANVRCLEQAEGKLSCPILSAELTVQNTMLAFNRKTSKMCAVCMLA